MSEWWRPWWPDLASFLAMGRHGRFVWAGLGLCALALALEWWQLRGRARRARQERQP